MVLRRRMAFGLVMTGFAGAGVVTACGNDADLCVGAECQVDAGLTDGSKGDATVSDAQTSDGGSIDGQPPAGCNVSQDIASQTACVSDAYGAFVNGMKGSDSNSGTKEAPFRTIGAAQAAGAKLGRIFVCATTYDEHVNLTKSVSLYGGYSCADWTYATANVPKIAPSTEGYALQLTGVTGVTIEDIAFASQPGGAPGASSVAAFVSGSTATFVRAEITAADAGPTPDAGTYAANYSAATALDGTASDGGPLELPAPICPACLLLPTPVSTGGASGSQSGQGAGGSPGGPAISGMTGGVGGTYVGGGCSSANIKGANSASAAGGAGAVGAGALGSSGWIPSSGSAAAPCH
jgi:uncharacterized membrane protein YgcG